MINVKKFGPMGVPKGQRKFTIPWDKRSQGKGELKDVVDATSLIKATDDIVSSHSLVNIPDYRRAFYGRPMWSNDLDPSRTNDVRTLEMNGNTYRSQVGLELAPQRGRLPRGYRKTSFRLDDDANTIKLEAQYKKGKLNSASHVRHLEDGTTERISFEINNDGTLTYESSRI